MTFNEEAHALFAYQQARLHEVGHEADMEVLAYKLGCTVQDAEASRLIGTDIHVRSKQCYAARQASIAHELSHKLAQERAESEDPEVTPPNFEEIIRYYHAQSANALASLESIITIGQDRIKMPDEVVNAIIGICGLNATAVWILHQQEEVLLREALRRLVYHDENARIGGFIARNGVIVYAESYRWHMPVWVGDPMPDPDDEFQGDGVSLFEVPGLPGTFIGLVILEDWGDL